MRGKAHVDLPVRGEGEDHPRVCGEKRYLLQDDITNEGSPPRMRGKD